MRFVWVETEILEREESRDNVGQIMVELDDGTNRFISAVRNADAADTWTYGVTNISVIPPKPDEFEEEENERESLVYFDKYDNLDAAKASEYCPYFIMAHLLVLSETEGISEHDDETVDKIIELIRKSPDDKMIKLLKNAARGSNIAVMRAAIRMNDVDYVTRYVREFENDEKGPGRFLEFDPSPEIAEILKANGGINEVIDWDIREIRDKLRQFNKDRDWEQFHTPENLAKSISIEAGELLECFKWSTRADRQNVCDELADVLMYCIMMADKMNIDIKKEMLRKIAINGMKYPIKKSKGKSAKYTKL